MREKRIRSSSTKKKRILFPTNEDSVTRWNKKSIFGRKGANLKFVSSRSRVEAREIMERKFLEAGGRQVDMRAPRID
jgi:hypothetical protein